MSHGARLILLHDDGNHEINIVVHGYSPLSCYPEFEKLSCQVNEAELRGRVYLFYWQSGSWETSSPMHGASAAVATFHLPAAFLINQIRHYIRNKNRAEEMGRVLYQALARVPAASGWPVTLIGHSLGARVVYWFLDAVTPERFNIRDVVLLGGAVESDAGQWEECARVVRRQIVNVWSGGDTILRGGRGIGNPVGLIPIDSNSRKIRNVRCSHGHLDYFPNFNWILSKAFPKRRRSKDYIGKVRVECPGPKCDVIVIMGANTEVRCPECSTDFSYDASDGRCYWVHRPKLVECLFCDEGEIYVQGQGRYQCPECRRWNDFQREGNRVHRA